MPKLITGSNSAALNADIIALFEEEDLDPIREMVKMFKEGTEYEDPETGEIKHLPLDPDQKFKVLKELAQYAAPKIKAVDVSERKKSKTIIKIVKHGERAVVANGDQVAVIENKDPHQFLDHTEKELQRLNEEVVEATAIPHPVVSAVRVEAYGGFSQVREEAAGVKVKEFTKDGD
jgi:nitrite reductase/ring-hydroxylating ferredoxin subunit